MSVRLKWVLGASLLLNVFLIAGGAGAGWVLNKHKDKICPPLPPGMTWEEKFGQMPEADRTRIATLLRESALSGEREIAQARDMRIQAATIAGQQPYDAAAIMAMSEQARSLEGQARAKVENTIITGLAAESPAVREKVIGHMLRASFRYRRFAMPDGPKGDEKPPEAAGAHGNKPEH